MQTKIKVIIILVVVIVFLLAWAPWLTDEYVIDKVTEKLGGPDAQYFYLSETMPIKDIPKEVSWLPFVRFIAFPGEAGWFVTFYGAVVP